MRSNRIATLAVCIGSITLLTSFAPIKTSEGLYNAANSVQSRQNNDKLNISLLLDLSDRISPAKHPTPAMEIYKRDLGYIESIVNGFEKHLRSKPIIRDDDYMQVYFEPAPANPTVNDLASKLKLHFTRANTTRETLQKISEQYVSISSKIYTMSVANKKYIGSDIWSFFKNKVHNYCIKPGHRNILFILTDGYMYHPDSKFTVGGKTSYITPALISSFKLNTPQYKNVMAAKSYGFVKATDGLNDLEVVVLGINPAKGNPFEGDVISEYWTTWFKSMGVKSPIIKPFSADFPSDLDAIIQKYINP